MLAAQAMGADFAYVGSAFIATDEARASRRLQADDRRQQQRRHRLLEPVHRRARQLPEGLDPQRRPRPRRAARERPEQDELRAATRKKAWKDIWGCGQGIGAVKAVVPAAELVARLAREYEAARACDSCASPARAAHACRSGVRCSQAASAKVRRDLKRSFPSPCRAQRAAGSLVRRAGEAGARKVVQPTAAPETGAKGERR